MDAVSSTCVSGEGGRGSRTGRAGMIKSSPDTPNEKFDSVPNCAGDGRGSDGDWGWMREGESKKSTSYSQLWEGRGCASVLDGQ